jgi:hypothetical protein
MNPDASPEPTSAYITIHLYRAEGKLASIDMQTFGNVDDRSRQTLHHDYDDAPLTGAIVKKVVAVINNEVLAAIAAVFDPM